MKKRLFLLLVILVSFVLVFALIGCGGGTRSSGGTGSNNISSAGSMTISVNWPDTKTIPSSTTKIKVNVYQSSEGNYETVVPEAEITRKSGATSSSTTIKGIPLGSKTVLAQAYNADNQELAYDTKEATITAGENSTVTLDLSLGQFPGFGQTTTKYAYVVNQSIVSLSKNKTLLGDGGNVTKINQSTYAVVSTISLDSSSIPYQAAITSDGGKVVITDYGTSKIYVIDTSADSVTSTRSSGIATHLVVTGNTAYISSYSTVKIFVFDITNNSFSDSISGSGSKYPRGIVYYNNYLYGVLANCTYGGFKTLTTETTPSLDEWISFMYEPSGPVALNTNKNVCYVPALGDETDGILAVIRLADGSVTYYQLNYVPYAVAISLDQNYVYVTDITENKVHKYSASNLVLLNQKTLAEEGSVVVGNSPSNMVVSSDGTKVWVVNTGSDTVSVINASDLSVVTTIDVGTSPMGIVLQP